MKEEPEKNNTKKGVRQTIKGSGRRGDGRRKDFVGGNEKAAT